MQDNLNNQIILISHFIENYTLQNNKDSTFAHPDCDNALPSALSQSGSLGSGR